MSNQIRNTTSEMRDPAEQAAFLAEAAFVGTDAIERQGAQGLKQLVASAMLPAQMGGPEAQRAFEALGFVFGDVDPHDPLFREAKLPAGWAKGTSDGATYVTDELGRKRVDIFYKAAFYDRRASMTLIGLHFYLYSCWYHGADVVTDGTWATPAAIVEAARSSAVENAKTLDIYQGAAAVGRGGRYTERISEIEAQNAWYTALEQRITQAGDTTPPDTVVPAPGTAEDDTPIVGGATR